MENPRPEKVAVVDEVRQRFDDADAAILTEYRGLTVKDIAGLRRTLRESGGEYKIYKNTLVRFAAADLGLEIDDMLTGPTAIAFIDGDAVSVAKALRDFARTNPNLVVKGGLLGNKLLSAKDASALAEIPPREVLLARIAGGLAAPMVQFAGLLQALPRNFAYGLKALIDMGGAPGAPAPAPAVDEAPAIEAEAEAPVDPDAGPMGEPQAAEPAEGAVSDAPVAGADTAEPTDEVAATDAPSDAPAEGATDTPSETESTQE